VEGVREIIRHAFGAGVPVLSLYAFSRENWGRSDEEVDGLMQLLGKVIENETDELVRQALGCDSSVASKSCRRTRPSRSAARSTQRPVGSACTEHRLQLLGPDRARGRGAQHRGPGLAPEAIDEDVIAASL